MDDATGSSASRSTPTAETLATAVAGELLNRIADAQAAGHVPHIGLTGGTIADAIHREVARMAAGVGVDWGAVHFWFGDERFVRRRLPRPQRRPGPRGVPRRGRRRPGCTRCPPPTRCRTRRRPRRRTPTSVRADGGGALRRPHARRRTGRSHRLALPRPSRRSTSPTPSRPRVHDSPKPPPDRVTLTFAALDRSHAVWFLVSGEAKADAVARALAEDGTDRRDPGPRRPGHDRDDVVPRPRRRLAAVTAAVTAASTQRGRPRGADRLRPGPSERGSAVRRAQLAGQKMISPDLRRERSSWIASSRMTSASLSERRSFT